VQGGLQIANQVEINTRALRRDSQRCSAIVVSWKPEV
jgi:hypothetical protein